jgi:glycerol-3-phosphate O-acyltransferase
LKSDKEWEGDMEIVERAVELLSGQLTETRSIIEVYGESSRACPAVLSLSLYRNQLLHVFQREALVSLTFASLVHRSSTRTVHKSDLFDHHRLLSSLLEDEFVDQSRHQVCIPFQLI